MTPPGRKSYEALWFTNDLVPLVHFDLRLQTTGNHDKKHDDEFQIVHGNLRRMTTAWFGCSETDVRLLEKHIRLPTSKEIEKLVDDYQRFFVVLTFDFTF